MKTPKKEKKNKKSEVAVGWHCHETLVEEVFYMVVKPIC